MIGIVAAVLATAVVLGVVGFMCNKHNKQKSGCCYCGSESSRGTSYLVLACMHGLTLAS